MSNPSIEYSPLFQNLSKEKRKRVDVASTKSLKVKAKQRKLLLQNASSSEGEWSASIISGPHWSLVSMVVKGISVPYYLSCPGKILGQVRKTVTVMGI